MRTIKWALPLITMLGLSCTAAKQSTATKTDHRKAACADMEIAADKLHIDWLVEKQNVLDDATTQLPATYQVYSIDSAQLAAFFSAVKDNSSDTTLSTAIPLPDGCQLFDAKAVAAKRKNISTISINGTDAATRQGVLSLNYNGVNMNGQVTMNNTTYIIKPVNNNAHIYYLVYEHAGPVFHYAPNVQPMKYTPPANTH